MYFEMGQIMHDMGAYLGARYKNLSDTISTIENGNSIDPNIPTITGKITFQRNPIKKTLMLLWNDDDPNAYLYYFRFWSDHYTNTFGYATAYRAQTQASGTSRLYQGVNFPTTTCSYIWCVMYAFDSSYNLLGTYMGVYHA